MRPSDDSGSERLESQNPPPFPDYMKQAAPNMQLNISINSKSTLQRDYMPLCCAFLSTTLQIIVLVVSGLTVYNQSLFTRIGAPYSPYGFLLFVTGTILLVLGMLICSYTIEQSTIERSWWPKRKFADHPKLGIIWLQGKQAVNDQLFDPFLVVGGVKDYVITSTREDPKPGNAQGESTVQEKKRNSGTFRSSIGTFRSSILPFSGSIFGLVGFFVQFQGLRGLSWPSSVAQLVAIILMAVLRAYIRNSLSHLPEYYSATKNFEMEWLSLRLVLCPNGSFLIPFLQKGVAIGRPKETANDGTKRRTRSPRNNKLFWRVITAEIYPGWISCHVTPGPFHLLTSDGEYCNEEKILRVRKRLGDLVHAPWEGAASKAAISLSKAIEIVMDKFFPEPYKTDNTDNPFTWSLETETGEEAEINPDTRGQGTKSSDTQTPKGIIRFIVEYSKKNKEWKTDSKVLDAALSLCMSHLQTKTQRLGTEVQYWQVIGDSAVNTLERDLSWWIKDTFAEELLKDDAVLKIKEPNSGIESPLLIGFQGSNGGNPEKTSNSSDPVKILAIRRNGALANCLAQHIFSAFMWRVAAKIPHDSLGSGEILQPEKFSKVNIKGSWTSPNLQIRELAQVAQAVEQAGLCRSDEAYISIIPPLSNLHKLPNEVMISLATERIAKRRIDWAEISRIYLDILQYSIIDQPCRYSSSMIAAVMEFLSFVSGPLLDKSDLEKMCKEAVPLKKALKETLQKLEQIDQGAFHVELQFLYKKQGRDSLFKRLFKKVVQSSKQVEKIPPEHQSAWCRLTEDHLEAMGSNSTALKSSEKDVFGWTPLHYAVTIGKQEQVKESKSLPILADMVGRTPVHYAAKCESHSVLQALLGTKNTQREQGRDAANEVEGKGMLPLHLAAQSGSAGEIVKLLLSYTNDINFRDKWGRTALYLAAENGSENIVEILLGKNEDDQKAKIDIECDDRLKRRTALHVAAASRHHNILSLLAGKDGRRLNWKGSDQKTALELAAANGCELSIKALVQVFGNRDGLVSEAPAPEKERELHGNWQEMSDNKVTHICHWKEALDLCIIDRHKKALIMMIKLAEGTSQQETWAHALSTAAKEGREEILAMLLDHKKPSQKAS